MAQPEEASEAAEEGLLTVLDLQTSLHFAYVA